MRKYVYGYTVVDGAAAFSAARQQGRRRAMKYVFKAMLVATVIAAMPVSTANAQAIDSVGSRFVPKGHSYDSSNNQLPTLNSYEDQTNSRVDAIETEIYKSRRDRAYWDTWVNSTHGTYLGGEPLLAPDY